MRVDMSMESVLVMGSKYGKTEVFLNMKDLSH